MKKQAKKLTKKDLEKLDEDTNQRVKVSQDDPLFDFDIEDYPIGKGITDYVTFPTFHGVSRQKVPIYVHRQSKKVSPCVVVTACVHGDEISGLRIAQKLMKANIKLLKGTLIIFPVVNIYGLYTKSRYLPDRKDLNRCFPGNRKGSFANRFAHFIFKNVTRYGDVFIDLHSAGVGRVNIPQVRCDFENKKIKKMLGHLSMPLLINNKGTSGSFRGALSEIDKPCILFEGGEGLRNDETITQYGFNLVKSILSYFKMIKPYELKNKQVHKIQSSKWLRAQNGGIFVNKARPGKVVRVGEVLGEVRKVDGTLHHKITAPNRGVIIGMSENCVLMTGDPLYHIGHFEYFKGGVEDDFYDYYEVEI